MKKILLTHLPLVLLLSLVSCGKKDKYKEGLAEGKRQGYSEGYEVGYDEGYTEGDTDGYERAAAYFETAGYNEGFTDGKVAGTAIGYSNGYTVGKNETYQPAYNSGYNAGYAQGDRNGYNEGYSNGYDDGFGDKYDQVYNQAYYYGYNDGYSDGGSDAWWDDAGYDVGYSNGFDDGYDVGYSDGYGLSIGKSKKFKGFADLISLAHNDVFDYTKISAPVATKKGLVANGKLILSETSQTNKDTLKRAAAVEQYLVIEMAKQVKGKFGLSAERSLKIAKAANHFRKQSSKRALTKEDTNAYASEVIGSDFSQIADAYEETLKGDVTAFSSVLDRAADKNGTSPENISLILTKYFM